MTRIPAAKDPTWNVRLPGEKMRKDGARLTIEPTPPKSLLAVLATLSPLEDDFPPISELVLDPVRF
jgi:antitoxin VapB